MSEKKIPVTIITGFLGAGKTTLVNTILQEFPSKKIGLIINEFGEVGVDGLIIDANEELKIEISNGCACCVVRGDLEEGIQKMITEVDGLDHIIVEASGLADPLPIVQTFVHNVQYDKQTYLDSVIAVIDTVNFASNWNEFDTLKKQVEFCDFIVLTKEGQEGSDVEKVKDTISKIRPTSVVVSFSPDSTQDISILLDTHAFDLSDIPHDHHHHHHDHEHFDEVVFSTKHALDAIKLDEIFTKDVFEPVVRAKGFVQLSQKEGVFLFQQVGHGRQLSPYPHTNFDTRIVFIGKHLDTEKILSYLSSCEVK